jgi:lipopolysaccharide transport system ATP-binding protein
MYVKLAFSVAAHLDSEIMIMDEVLAVGDMAFQKKCLDKMKEVSSSQNRTILYVSHNMATIRSLCNRCLVLEHGQLIFDGDVEKAIGIYLNSNLSGDYSINYVNYKRATWVENERIRINCLEQICDCKQPPFCIERKDGLVISILLHSTEIQSDVSCRFEIRDELDAPLASSNVFNLSIKKGINNLKLKYDLSSLATGRYRGVLVIFSIGGKGDYIIEDWVDGIPFEIIDTYNTGKIKWNRKDFGSIMLPDGVLFQ